MESKTQTLSTQMNDILILNNSNLKQFDPNTFNNLSKNIFDEVNINYNVSVNRELKLNNIFTKDNLTNLTNVLSQPTKTTSHINIDEAFTSLQQIRRKYPLVDFSKQAIAIRQSKLTRFPKQIRSYESKVKQWKRQLPELEQLREVDLAFLEVQSEIEFAENLNLSGMMGKHQPKKKRKRNDNFIIDDDDVNN